LVHINDKGQIAGSYSDSSSNGTEHGFVANLAQAMASFGANSGAAHSLHTVAYGTEASQQSFLTTPQHA
jgi:hypothetical protein